MKILFIGLFVALWSISPSLAQGADGGAESRKAKGRVAWFVYTSMPEGLENPVSILSGADLSEVLLYKLSPSEPVKIPADGVIRIVRPVPNSQKPDKPEYITLAQASVPDNVSKALIILMPVAANTGGRVFQAKVQDLAGLKGGDSMFLNMTNLQIGIELGKAKIRLGPGQAETHNPLGSEQSVSLPFRLSYFHPERQEWSMITASTVALYSTRKELCIFNWNSQFNRVAFESITLPHM
jgi:hypothetical protein